MKQAAMLCAALWLALSLNVFAQDQTVPPKSWAGKWHGTLVNLPLRQGATAVEVTLELGEFPQADKSCAMWRTTYSEGGVVRQVKDYKLCRGTGADDLFVDEGDGVKLTARWLGDVLVTPFKYDNLLLIASTRLRGNVLEEEILTVDDKPTGKGVQPLRPRGLQRLELKRIP